MTGAATRRRRFRGDRGDTVIALALASAFVLLLVVQTLNVIVFSYGKGAVRAAVDEAARAGSRGGLAACQATADQVVEDLLGGALGAQVSISCSDAGRRVVATASVHFDGWLSSVADYDGTFSASAAKEDR
jgi:hypothetical protein